MAAISSNGRMIAFRSDATNLSTLVGHSIYAHDTCFGAAAGCTPSTTLVSTAVATNHPNNAQGAALGAQQWVKDIGEKGNYVELLGNPSDNNAATRSNGYETVLSQYPDLKKVGSQVANWDRAQGHDKMQSLLQAHPDIIGVISGNDEMALGAIAALKETGKLSSVKVGGFDGSPDAVAAIKSGEMQYTVLQPVAVYSKQAVEEADSFLKTGKTGAASEKQLFDCSLITKDNAADYIAPFTLK